MPTIAVSRQPLCSWTVFLPTGDGIATIMQMRRERPEVKIIAMSGGGRIGHMGFPAIAKKLGANANLKKPFTVLDLVAIICGMLEQLPSTAVKADFLVKRSRIGRGAALGRIARPR